MRLLPVLLFTVASVCWLLSLSSQADPIWGEASQFTGKGSYAAYIAAVKFYNQAASFVAAKKYDEAIATYQQAIATYPYDESSYDGLGYALERKGDFQQAEKALKHAIELKSTWGPWMNLANVYHRQGRLGECRSAVLKALQLNPPPAAKNKLDDDLRQLDVEMKPKSPAP